MRLQDWRYAAYQAKILFLGSLGRRTRDSAERQAGGQPHDQRVSLGPELLAPE